MVSVSNIDMTSIASSSNSTIFENVESIDETLENRGLEDSGTFDGDSQTTSDDQINENSCSPVSSAAFKDEKHIYTNIKEMDEITSKASPPIPGDDAVPKRNLNNGWMEYETDLGRTYFYNSDTSRSQWIPPRFIRTPAEVEAFLKATKDDVDEHFTTTSDVIEDEPSEDIHYASSPINKTSSGEYDVPRKMSTITTTTTTPIEQQQQRARSTSGGSKVSSNVQYDTVPSSPTTSSASTFFNTSNKSHDVIMTSFSSNSSASDPLGVVVQPVSTAITMHTGSPGTQQRSQSFKHGSARQAQLKNVPLPQVLPTTASGFQCHEMNTLDRPLPKRSEYADCDEKRVDHRGAVKNVRCGNMEMSIEHSSRDMTQIQWHGSDTMIRAKRKEWQQHFMYLTSAHLILYKDEKAAEKLGNHYAPPIGVCDLRGATVSWAIEKEKKKRKVIQLELSYGPKYLLRTGNDGETNDWFEALRDVIANLPTVSHTSGLPINPSVLDPSCAIVRNPSTLSNRPHSTALLTTTRSSSKRDPMTQSSIEAGSSEEPQVSRQTILERLRRFFRTRPTVESLKEKGIYKHEPVFGSTLANICALENSLVPKFIRIVTELVESKGLEIDGLYRVSGNLSSIQRIRCQVDQDKYNALVNEEDVHVLTGSLKLFFRELSEPVFPMAMTKDFLSAIKLQVTKQRFKRFDELLKTLPQENRETLKMLLRHLHRVAAHSDKNRMQAHNLAIMFGPTLFFNGEEKTKKEPAKKGKGNKNKEEPAPVQSNSHLAFNMIMQGQIVEYLLNEHSRFEALQGPVLCHPPN